MDYKTAVLYSQLKTYKYLVSSTCKFIEESLNKVKNPYIACSFGKDSAVMLHLILSIKKDIKVRFIRWEGETEHIDNYDDVIKEWGNINLDQIILSRTNLFDKRKERYDTNGFYDSFFVGLRAQESTVRRITLKKLGVFYLNNNNMYRICPLAFWDEKSIATYVLVNNLPTLNSYKKHGLKSRTASRIPRADFGIREQFLVDLKNRDFQAYQNLLLKFPEINL